MRSHHPGRAAPLVAMLALAACTTNQISVQNTAIVAAAARPGPGPFDIPAAHLSAGDIGVLPHLGESFSGAIPLLDRSIPLPNGTWQVAAVQRNTHRGLPPTAAVGLVRIEGKSWSGVLEIEGNRLGRASTTGFPLHRTCLVAGSPAAAWNRLYGDVATAVPGGNQDCLAIGFLNTTAWHDSNRAQLLQGLARSFESLGLLPPPTTVYVAFAQADAEYILTEQLWLNPDLAGIPPDTEPRAALSGWLPAKLAVDPAKSAYLARLTGWAQGWRPVVRQALAGSATAPTSVAEIR